MTDSGDDLIQMAIVWKHSGDAEFPYIADVEGHRLTIRINDFPAEPLYTLMINDVEVAHLDDWPGNWFKPNPPQHLLDLLEPKN